MPRANHQYLPLTEGQIDYLRDGEDPKSVDSMHYDIRNRLFHTIKNGDAVARLPKDQREQVFDMRGKKTTDPDVVQSNGPNSLTNRELWKLSDYGQFYSGLVNWLAFLYAGIDEADNVVDVTQPRYEYDLSLQSAHDEMDREERAKERTEQIPKSVVFDFHQLLERAVERVARRQGETVTKFELQVETEPIEPAAPPSFDTERLRSRFESGDPELTGPEIAHLQTEADDIGPEEIQAYREKLYEPSDYSGGFGPNDEVRDAFDEED